MPYRPETPFDSIESAQEYLTLLSEVIAETRLEVEADFALLADAAETRRRDAMQLVGYKLERLESHVAVSRRLLNDLRLLRRLLLAERQGSEAAEEAAVPVPSVARRAPRS
jgi:hypothetical protein